MEIKISRQVRTSRTVGRTDEHCDSLSCWWSQKHEVKTQSPSLNHYFWKLGCLNIYWFMESFKTTLTLSVLLDWAWETESTSDQSPPLCPRTLSQSPCANHCSCQVSGFRVSTLVASVQTVWSGNTQISLWKWNMRLRKYKSIFTNCYSSFFTYTYPRRRLKMRTSNTELISHQHLRWFFKYTYFSVARNVFFKRQRPFLFVDPCKSHSSVLVTLVHNIHRTPC